MSEIETLPFNKENFERIREYKFGRNWPVVYIAENGKEMYIGETINAYFRSKQHYENETRRKLKTLHIISDEEYNKSATLDIESWLIQYMVADGKFVLQNGNKGLRNHNYFDKEKYKAKFESIIWTKLMEMGLAQSKLVDLKNSDLFKYSPYKTLTEDQFDVVKKIEVDLKKGLFKSYIINGKPGTGKTILAIYLIKYLKEKEETKHLKIGLIVPMTGLRKTIKKVFSNINGLKSSMVIGPSDAVGENYDLVLVDESHRLHRRQGIPNYGAFDATNKELGLDNNGTELDWIVKSSKSQIFFYDKNQSVRPSDVRPEDFKKMNAKYYDLVSQMRIEAGADYIDFIENMFDLIEPKKTSFPGYDLKLFHSADEMITEIKSKENEHKLSRVVAGYAWNWSTKGGKPGHDIEIGDLKLVWNSTVKDWVNSPNAINEVGCIHTVQGYDLNYVGVIIGPEFSYDEDKNIFLVDKKKYFDINGKNGITDPQELVAYIKNIYKTLLTRGIKGTYIYIADLKLRRYFEKYIHTVKPNKLESPYLKEVIKIPLYDSVGCGNFMFADSVSKEFIEIDSNLVNKGSKYFVLRTVGDSMNKAGINDGDLVLCQKNYTPSIGSNVVALIGDDATIKEFAQSGNKLILKPKSSNAEHKDLVFMDGDDVKIQGVVVRVLDTNTEIKN